MQNKLLGILVMTIFFGCSYSGEKASSDQVEAYGNASEVVQKEEVVQDVISSDPGSLERSPILIHTGRIGYRTKHYEKMYAHIQRVIHQQEGYVSSEEEESDDFAVRNTIVLRIPSANFDKAMKLLNDLPNAEAGDETLYKRIESDDVTEEFYDLEARIKTKRSIEMRYLAILREATTVKDILAVEADLRIIREEIESKEGRLRYLKNRVGYSTIHIFLEEVNEDSDVDYENSFWEKMSSALKMGWKGVEVVVLGLVAIWPLILIGVFGFFLVRKRFRRG